MSDSSSPGIGRRVIASAWAALAMPYLVLAVVVPVARALGLFASLSVPVVATLGALAGPLVVATLPRLAKVIPESLDGWLEPGNRKLAALWSASALFGVVSVCRIAVFLGDPTRVSESLIPSDSFLVRHSCLTAYMHGAILSTDPTANVYDMAFVGESGDAPLPLPPTAIHFAPFHLDAFGYPPPFLLLPRALLLVTRDFMSQRMIVAAFSFLLVLCALAFLARTLGGVAERRIWLLTPLFMGHPLVLITLQVGNFHLAAVALCVLCWVALEQRKDGVSGALLAVATLAKIFPGLLGVLLLVQRRWRTAGFALLWGAAAIALSVAVLGTKVWSDFLFYHLPRVQSGEALRFMAASPREIAFNLAPFGIPFKLGALGLAGWGWAQAPLFGSVYTVVLLLLAVIAGLNAGGPQHRVTVWLSMLMFASLRSPYAAPFVLTTFIVLLLVLAAEVRSRRGLAAFVTLVALFSVSTPATDPKTTIAVSLVRTVPLVAVLLWVVLRREAVAKRPHPRGSRTDHE